MRRLLAPTALSLALLLTGTACGGETDPNAASAPASSSDLEGEDYEDVVSRFEDAGFTDVSTKKIDDLITGWLTKDGEVERVSVNGRTEFGEGDDFPKDSKIVVTFHTFPEKEAAPDKEPAAENETEKPEESTPADPAPKKPAGSEKKMLKDADTVRATFNTLADFDAILRIEPGRAPGVLYVHLDPSFLIQDIDMAQQFINHFNRALVETVGSNAAFHNMVKYYIGGQLVGENKEILDPFTVSFKGGLK